MLYTEYRDEVMEEILKVVDRNQMPVWTDRDIFICFMEDIHPGKAAGQIVENIRLQGVGMAEIHGVSKEYLDSKTKEFFLKQWSSSKIIGYYLRTVEMGVSMTYFEAWRYRGEGIPVRVHSFLGVLPKGETTLIGAYTVSAEFRDGLDVTPYKLRSYNVRDGEGDYLFYDLESKEAKMSASNIALYKYFSTRVGNFNTARGGSRRSTAGKGVPLVGWKDKEPTSGGGNYPTYPPEDPGVV